MLHNAVCAIVITFHPTSEDLLSLGFVRPQVQTLLIVDNGSSGHSLHELRQQCKDFDIVLIENGGNRGIASALNIGVRWAIKALHKWVLLLDQDSVVTPNFVSSMLHDFLSVNHPKVMQVIPRYLDPDTGEEEVIPRTQEGRVFITRTSGSFFSLKIFENCGLFREELFIYCVDDDFSLRMHDHGFTIIQSATAVLRHASGHPTYVSILGRRFVTRNYRPEVQYYWARNRVWLLSQYGRRFPGIVYPSIRALIGIPIKILLGEERRRLKLFMFTKGLAHGLLGRSGAIVEIVD